MMAIAAAKRTGQDWRAAALAARRRMVDEADRRRAQPVPEVGSVADLARSDDLAGDA